jgi:hypothetical protein
MLWLPRFMTHDAILGYSPNSMFFALSFLLLELLLSFRLFKPCLEFFS